MVGGDVLFRMDFVGSLLTVDVLLLLVSMVGAWVWLLWWLGKVGLFALVNRSVAVGWLCWVALRLAGVLTECCWLMVSVLSLCRWVVGI